MQPTAPQQYSAYEGRSVESHIPVWLPEVQSSLDSWPSHDLHAESEVPWAAAHQRREVHSVSPRLQHCSSGPDHQLAFSKRPRTVVFKPYSLADYKRQTAQLSGERPKGTGPKADDEDMQRRRSARARADSFARRIRRSWTNKEPKPHPNSAIAAAIGARRARWPPNPPLTRQVGRHKSSSAATSSVSRSQKASHKSTQNHRRLQFSHKVDIVPPKLPGPVPRPAKARHACDHCGHAMHTPTASSAAHQQDAPHITDRPPPVQTGPIPMSQASQQYHHQPWMHQRRPPSLGLSDGAHAGQPSVQLGQFYPHQLYQQYQQEQQQQQWYGLAQAPSPLQTGATQHAYLGAALPGALQAPHPGHAFGYAVGGAAAMAIPSLGPYHTGPTHSPLIESVADAGNASPSVPLSPFLLHAPVEDGDEGGTSQDRKEDAGGHGVQQSANVARRYIQDRGNGDVSHPTQHPGAPEAPAGTGQHIHGANEGPINFSTDQRRTEALSQRPSRPRAPRDETTPTVSPSQRARQLRASRASRHAAGQNNRPEDVQPSPQGTSPPSNEAQSGRTSPTAGEPHPRAPTRMQRRTASTPVPPTSTSASVSDAVSATDSQQSSQDMRPPVGQPPRRSPRAQIYRQRPSHAGQSAIPVPRQPRLTTPTVPPHDPVAPARTDTADSQGGDVGQASGESLYSDLQQRRVLMRQEIEAIRAEFNM